RLWRQDPPRRARGLRAAQLGRGDRAGDGRREGTRSGGSGDRQGDGGVEGRDGERLNFNHPVAEIQPPGAAPAVPSVANRLSSRARAWAASASRVRAVPSVTRAASRVSAAAEICSTAVLKAASFALEGF